MTEFLFQAGISNACFALALAMLATIVGAASRRPHLAYLLWMLVFVKLVTPPVFNIPLPKLASNSGSTIVHDELLPDMSNGTGATIANADSPLTLVRQSSMDQAAWQSGWIRTKPWLSGVWMLGTGLVIGWSLFRVFQFHRLLHANSTPATPEILRVARRLAGQLKLRSLPKISTTPARISPLVWWVGGRVHVVIPQSLLEEMERDSWQWVLAHELAHVRRRDYLVRWLEWFAVACFWWNPVVWWAQRNLRASEELCCDALVLSRLNPDCHAYADSILKTVESLVCPAFRPPAMASEINSGGYLERRVVMIMSGNVMKENSRLLQIGVLALALAVFPLGLVSGQDFEKVEKRLQKSVEKGELSQEQAEAMLQTLKKSADRDSDRADRDAKRAADTDRARKDHSLAAEELEKAVREQKISKEDMEKRLVDLQFRIAERQKLEGGQQFKIALEDYARATEAMKDRVAEGKVSQEDMDRRLAEMKKAMVGQKEAAREARRSPADQEYARAADAMKKMAAEGKIKKEDLEKRLAEMKKAMAEREIAGAESRRTITLEQYAQAAETMKEMVAEGKIKPEGMEQRLVEMRKMIGEKRENSAERGRTLTREQFSQAAAEMEKMVAEGKAKKEDVTKRLAEMRKMLGDAPRDGSGKTSEDGVRAQADKLRAIEEKIRAAVEAGDLTAEEAREKQAALRAEMAGAARATDDRVKAEMARDLEFAAEKLKEAVKSGMITGEEAEAKIRALKAEKKPEKDQAKKSDRNPDDSRNTYADEFAREIRQAVADGKITRTEAEAKLKYAREQATQKKDAAAKKDKDDDRN